MIYSASFVAFVFWYMCFLLYYPFCVFPRDAMHSADMPSQDVCMSVCLSVR